MNSRSPDRGQASDHAAAAAPPASARRRWRAGSIFGALGVVFVVIAASLVLWMAVDQRLVVSVAAHLQEETVPWTLERQRLGRNLEQLRLEGQRVLTATSPAARDEALFLIRMLSAHPSMKDDPRTAQIVAEVERFLLKSVADGGRPDLAGWETLSNRLRLLADDLSVEGGQRMTAELERMTEAMRQARYKLLFNLLLMAGFLGSFLLILRRNLVLPLQRIHSVLTSLDARGPAPDLPPASVAEIHAVDNAIVRFHSTLQENEEVRQKLERLATTDGMTGLFNRRHFMGLAADELARACRYGRPIAVGIADLDHFKRVNDRFGHAAGDLVLQHFAEIVADALRQTDRVCRYGGEEFAFIFPETTPEEAVRLGERLRVRLAEAPVRLPDGRSVATTFSLGLADASGRPLEESLTRADLALYQAKRMGRNRIVVAHRPDEAAGP